MNISAELFDFIRKSPTAYHTVAAVKERLLQNGYREINEGDKPSASGKYFITKNGSSIIAFRPRASASGFMIAAAHSDSPAFRLKASADAAGAYTRLEVEKYGGMIYYTWLDRPLSLAGRLLVKTDSGIESRLVDIERDIAVIPSVAIHLNRAVNDGYKFNPAVDLLPIVSALPGTSVLTALAEVASVRAEDIISHDVFLYNREPGRIIGISDDLLLSPRLDDLEGVFASLEAFLTSSDCDSVPVLAVFDNEEVGSETKQGAASAFLSGTLMQIAGESYSSMLKNSFMASVDNAHAKHPNRPELSDASNAPRLNGGIVVKWNANQRYATDGVSAAVFRTLCERAGVRTQTYYNRADLPGGSTLGTIADVRVPVPTVDIGLPQLAMHSAVETAGAEDLGELIKALRELFSTSICTNGDKIDF